MTDTVQKITPCLWVEKDAKAVANYYLSILRMVKLKDFRSFDTNESGNDAGLETAVIEIAGIEFSILAAGPYSNLMKQFHLSSIQKTRLKRTTFGKHLHQMEVRKVHYRMV